MLPKLIRLPELAETLDVTPETVQSWVRAGKFLPARRLGAAWVWPENELAEYLGNLPHAHLQEQRAAD